MVALWLAIYVDSRGMIGTIIGKRKEVSSWIEQLKRDGGRLISRARLQETIDWMRSEKPTPSSQTPPTRSDSQPSSSEDSPRSPEASPRWSPSLSNANLTIAREQLRIAVEMKKVREPLPRVMNQFLVAFRRYSEAAETYPDPKESTAIRIENVRAMMQSGDAAISAHSLMMAQGFSGTRAQQEEMDSLRRQIEEMGEEAPEPPRRSKRR